MVEIVANDPALAHRYRLLTSMPGVGLLLACTLIALLPELGCISRKQVAALVGVAPYAFESGTLKGRRCIWGGRANVRQVLDMAAMSASNWNPALKPFHDRLNAAGKKPKVCDSSSQTGELRIMRYELTDHEWTAIRPMLPNKPRGVPRVNDRRVLNGIFWVLRSGAPWRDLPQEFGPYTTCYNRFVRWRRGGSWGRINSDGNATDVNRNLGGAFTGFDRRFGEWRAGLAGGYTNSSPSVARQFRHPRQARTGFHEQGFHGDR